MNKTRYLQMFLVLIVCGRLLAQAPDTIWVSKYNGPGNGFDGTNDCVADNQGNLYVVGSSEDTNGNNGFDFILIKYNTADGDTIWTRNYNGPASGMDQAARCVMDNSGNLFVVGYSSNGSNDDFLIIKYNPSTGDTVWTRRFDGTANGDDHAAGCAVDGSGNLYVTGFSENGTDNDYLTIKYNSVNGDTIWTRRYNSSINGDDRAFGCSVDGSGNLYVCGYSYNGFDYNLLTVKYNASGDTSWTRKSTDTLDSLRYPQTDCVADNSDNVYVIGMCGINRNFQNRYSVITKYSSSGDSTWLKRYDGPTTYDQPLGCALDASGNLYVSGTSYDNTKDDCFTIKYNSLNGNILWTKRYIAGPTNSSYGIGCVLDNSGYLYVTGQAEAGGSNYDSFTIKYESTSTSIGETAEEIPVSFSLYQNYPNPFNPTTNIEFSIPQSKFVTLKIYNILGEEVATLVSEGLAAGKYKYDWDAGNWASGVYLYKIQAGNYSDIKKMILLR